MTVSKRTRGRRLARRAVGAATAGLAAGIVAFAAVGAATAQPTPPDPCSPASMMRAHAAAMTQMADYLDSRPDVQQAFTDARSKATPQERYAAVQAYSDTHPDVAAAFKNMHQPVEDLTARCGLPIEDTIPGEMAPPVEMAPGA